MAMGIMDFVQRFNALQVQRETGNELIKVINHHILVSHNPHLQEEKWNKGT